MRSTCFLASAAIALCLAAAPGAQAQDARGVTSFPAGHFAPARPADAYDMIRRLPGFTLIEGDADVRGLGAARGNVLFDGRVPASKQESLADLLRRIPAVSVERIELIRGGADGIDMGGFDLIANVVRRRGGETRAAAEAGIAIARDGVVRPQARLEVTRESGGRRLEGALALATEVDDESGRGRLVESDAAGNILSAGRRREWEVQQTASASAGYQTPFAGGELSGNASLARETTSEQVLADGEPTSERERVWRAELGGRFRKGGLELTGLYRRDDLSALARDGDERFSEDTLLTESVARAEYRREGRRLAFNTSLEGAINRLRSETALEEAGVPVPLPGSDARVTERRAEVASGLTWRAGGGIIVEPSLRAEISSLRSRDQQLSLFYLKPRLAVALPFAGGQLRLVGERSVGQLDFKDFVSSASLDRGDVSAGAQALRPASSWSLGATWERRFLGDGALLLSYRHDWIGNVVDRVAVAADGEIFDAVGNIGGSSRHVGRIEFTLPFAVIGLPGLQLRSTVTVQRSRVTDPVTGRRRTISEERPLEGELAIVHDLPGGRWSWGAELTLAHRERQFRFDEVRLERKSAMLNFHVEYRPAPDWRLRLEVANLTTRRLRETREKYDGPRDTGGIDTIERLDIRSTPLVSLSLRRAFGRGG